MNWTYGVRLAGREVAGTVNAAQGLLPVYGRGMLGTVPFPAFLSKLRVLAAVLRSRVRLTHGDVVFVLAPTGIHVAVLYYTLMPVGAVVSPANPSLTAAEVSRLLALSDPTAVAGTRGKAISVMLYSPKKKLHAYMVLEAWCFLARFKE